MGIRERFFFAVIYMLFIGLAEASANQGQSEILYFVDRAIKGNEYLKSLFYTKQAVEEEAKAYRGLLLPQISFEEEFSRSNYPPAVWMGKMGRKDVSPEIMNLEGFNDPPTISLFRSSIVLRYPLFRGFGIVSLIRQKEIEAEMALEQYNLSKEEIALKAIKSYLDVCYANSKIEASKKDIESAEYHVKLAESRYKQGVALLSDVLKAKVYLSSARDKLETAKTYYEVSLSQLAVLIGESPTKKIQVSCKLEEIYNSLKHYSFNDIESLIQKGLNNRKDIKNAEKEISLMESKVKESKSLYYPHIDLYMSQDWFGHNYPGQSEGSSTTFGAVLKFTIFDGFSRERRVRATENLLLKSKENLSLKTKEVSTEILASALKIRESVERILLAENAVREAEESLRIIEARYKEGLATITELTDTQSALYQARSNLIGAYYDFALSVYNTEFSTGTLLEFLGITK